MMMKLKMNPFKKKIEIKKYTNRMVIIKDIKVIMVVIRIIMVVIEEDKVVIEEDKGDIEEDKVDIEEDIKVEINLTIIEITMEDIKTSIIEEEIIRTSITEEDD